MGRRKSETQRVERSYGILPFVLEEVEGEGQVTGRAGLVTVAEAARGMGVREVVDREVRVKVRERGDSEYETIESFVLLMADGGSMATLVSHARQLLVRVERRLEGFVVRLSQVRVRLWKKTPVWERAMVCTDSS